MSRKIHNNKIKIIYTRLAIKYGLNSQQVKDIVESQFKFAKEKIKELDFSDCEDKESFDSIKKNFRFQYLGKIYTNYYIYKSINKKRNNELREN